MCRRAFMSGVMFFGGILTGANLLYGQPVMLTETDIKETDAAVKMLFSTNKAIPIECYDLSSPPQIIIDFMGEIYTNKPEVMMVNKGVVKQLRVVRGTKKMNELEDSYYAVDFIIVDLNEISRYDFDQGLTTAVLVVSKPGKVVSATAAKEEVTRIKEPEEAVMEDMPKVKTLPAEAAPVVAALPQDTATKSKKVRLEDKEYEMPAVVEKDSSLTEPAPAEIKGKTSKMKKGVGGLARGAGKAGKSLKDFFTFGKKKQPAEVKAKEPAAAKETKHASRRRSAKRAEPKQAEKTVDMEKTAPAEQPAQERRREAGTSGKSRPLSKFKSAKKEEGRSRSRKTDGVPAGRKSSVVSGPEERLELAKKSVETNKLNVKTAADGLMAAKAAVQQSLRDEDAVNQEVAAAEKDSKTTQQEYESSLQRANFTKNAANTAWEAYTQVKSELSALLKEGADDETLSVIRKKYDGQKVKLENVINLAEEIKKERELKHAESMMAREKYNSNLAMAAEPHKKTLAAQGRYESAQANFSAANKQLTAAEAELSAAGRAYQQYELEEAEAEYKKSLMSIDSSIIKKEEEERVRQAEAARLKKIEEEKAKESEAARRRKTEEESRAKEEARMAARSKLEVEEKKVKQEKKKEESAAGRRRRKSEPVVNSQSAEVSTPRSEILKSAVELRNAGLEMQRNGDLDSAVKYYLQALMSDSQYATVHNDLGILYEQKGLDEKAKSEYLSALKINPRYAKSHSNLALLYEKLGDNNKAYYHWKQRVQLGNPDDPWTQKAKERMEALEQRKQ
ncbi:MAG: hypothetical protein KJ893_05560 [Candidatus Omnitrophica bacterium]|nr:hypothetical protein [Candidatus Omnitrophota bacterium]MBU4477741.1 hypothetical protein [Candidatus Omnitrophota bacterium]MCG2703033.1 hypothetical protein [Candidatus Omnitrophota bacterium]